MEEEEKKKAAKSKQRKERGVLVISQSHTPNSEGLLLLVLWYSKSDIDEKRESEEAFGLVDEERGSPKKKKVWSLRGLF